jgi:hypothetical protein
MSTQTRLKRGAVAHVGSSASAVATAVVMQLRYPVRSNHAAPDLNRRRDVHLE